MKIGWIGLGVMGFPMAGHLSRAGHDVTVYNRTAAKAANWADIYGGVVAESPVAAARGMDVIITCVGNDDDLRAVTIGPAGCYAALEAGGLHIDHTTASATVARELAEAAAQRGAALLDAPVSGGQAGAEDGCLTIMCGGSVDAYEMARPVLECYARAHDHLGANGAGQLTKMCNQIAICGVVQSLSEAIVFAEAAGLDVERAFEVIRHGAAGSWQMSNRYRSMHAREFDFGFAVDWMRKDLAIVKDAAESLGVSLPTVTEVDERYARVQATGGARWDTSSLIALLGSPERDKPA